MRSDTLPSRTSETFPINHPHCAFSTHSRCANNRTCLFPLIKKFKYFGKLSPGTTLSPLSRFVCVCENTLIHLTQNRRSCVTLHAKISPIVVRGCVFSVTRGVIKDSPIFASPQTSLKLRSPYNHLHA